MRLRPFVIAILAGSALTALTHGPDLAVSGRGSLAAEQAPSLSPWGLFTIFVKEASGGFQHWQPRCQLIRGACGAGPFLNGIVVPDNSVWFNQAASAYVQSLTSAGEQAAQSISFPEGSVIARPAWAIVKRGAFLRPGDRLNLPIYNPAVVHFDPHNPAASQLLNFPHPAIDIGNNACTARTKASGAIPLGCFFHFNVTAATADHFQTDMLNVNAGDMAVLLGFHLIVKQDGHWNWSTYWWQAQPSPGALPPCGSNRGFCGQIPPAWTHYLMAKVSLPSQPSAIIPPVMNPYIEGPTANNVYLNCAVCHRFASQPMHPNVRSSTALGAQGPTTLTQWKTSAAAYLSGREQTDNIWTIAEYLSGSRSIPE